MTRIRTGVYNVDFGHDVSHCAITGSVDDPGARNSSIDPPAAGFISFTESGNNSGPLPNVVLVGTRNADAVLADGIPFSIHADC